MTPDINFTRLVLEIRSPEPGGNQRGDSELTDLLRLVLDFHYEDIVYTDDSQGKQTLSAEAMMLEDIHFVMKEAERAGIPKLESVLHWLNDIVAANADEIELALRTSC